MLSPRLLVFFWLSLSLQHVIALNAASAYEAVYFYNAYKMEFATVSSAADRKIATGCVHAGSAAPPDRPAGIVEAAFIANTVAAGVPGICSFKDFIGWVGNVEWRRFSALNPTVANPTSLSITLNPDADAIDQRIRDQGLTGRRLMKPLALLRGALEAEPFPSIMSQMSDIVQKARVARAAGAGLAIIDTWVHYSVGLLSTVSQFRMGDNAGFFMSAIRADPSWTSSPMSTYAKVNDVQYRNMAGFAVTGPNSANTYEVIDYETSFADAKAGGNAFSRAQKKALTAFSQNYGKGPPAGFTGTDAERQALEAAKIHRDVIDTVKYSRDLHAAPLEAPDADAGCTCCIVM